MVGQARFNQCIAFWVEVARCSSQTFCLAPRCADTVAQCKQQLDAEGRLAPGNFRRERRGKIQTHMECGRAKRALLAYLWLHVIPI